MFSSLVCFQSPGKPGRRVELASCSAQNSPKQAGWRWGAESMGPEGTFHPVPPQHPNVTQSHQGRAHCERDIAGADGGPGGVTDLRFTHSHSGERCSGGTERRGEQRPDRQARKEQKRDSGQEGWADTVWAPQGGSHTRMRLEEVSQRKRKDESKR